MGQSLAHSQESGGYLLQCIYNARMESNRHYDLIARSIRWVADHHTEQPDLNSLAAAMAVSPYHLQRTFQAWAGVSPKQFLKLLTRHASLQRLLTGSNVLDAAYSTGLSGAGRLHDLLVTTDALTPGEIRKHGAGVKLQYGFGDTPFGPALVCWNQRGLSFLGFCHERGNTSTLEELRSLWSEAQFSESSEQAQDWTRRIFAETRRQPLQLWLRGTPFQLKVWEALLAIPEGTHVTYGSLAQLIGQPTASRAVGRAVGANPLAWIIPCHRVIRQVGELGGYRWGKVTKQAMVGFEAVRQLSGAADIGGAQVHVHA